MNLTFGNWPPLASHSACFLIGAIIVSIHSHSQPKNFTLNPKEVIIPIKQQYFNITQSNHPHNSLSIIKIHKNYRCKIDHNPLRVLNYKDDIVYVATKKNDPTTIQALISAHVILLPLHETYKIPLCNFSKQQISYGT